MNFLPSLALVLSILDGGPGHNADPCKPDDTGDDSVCDLALHSIVAELGT